MGTMLHGWRGLLTQQSIVDQLAHIAAINGMTPEQLTAGGMPMWNLLASKAFGIDDDEIQTAVINTMIEYRAAAAAG